VLLNVSNASVSDPELVVHIFAHADGPYVDEAHDGIRRMWARCRSNLGMTETVEATALPAALPAALGSASSQSTVIAARQSAAGDFQAVLRRAHEVLNLSILVSPRPRKDWPELDRMVAAVLENDTDILIGIVRLFLGKSTVLAAAASPDFSRSLATLLPDTEHAHEWWRRGISTRTFSLWETSPLLDTRTEREFVVLAAPEHDARLGDWVWSAGGGPAIPPLARYLMHMAAMRYQLRVRLNYPSAGELSARLDTDRLDEAREEQAATAVTIGAMRAMHRTVEITVSNALAALAPDDREHADGPFRDDRDLAEWLTQHLDDDITYLEAAYQQSQRVVGTSGGATRAPARVGPSGDAPTFGIVTALREERTAMQVLLDNPRRHPVGGDRAHYVLGTLPSADPSRPHQVVLTVLGETGTQAAANACANLARSFATVNCVIMTGIAAGVPDRARPERHVRLGDIVVGSWGVVDYDHVVDRPGESTPRQPHPVPSPLLVHCAKELQVAEELAANGQGMRSWERWISVGASSLESYGRPGAHNDRLFAADSDTRPVPHPPRRVSGHRPGQPKVHLGVIGSGDRALRSIEKRDELATRFGLLAVEMEATGIGKAGFSNGLEWFVVRGISDYGDQRTDDTWRRYASLAAAAYVRALLAECSPLAVRGGHTRTGS
jgi:nucleoside phosphorylase